MVNKNSDKILFLLRFIAAYPWAVLANLGINVQQNGHRSDSTFLSILGTMFFSLALGGFMWTDEQVVERRKAVLKGKTS